MNKKLMVWLAVAAVAVVVLVVLVSSNQSVNKGIDGAELLKLQASGASIVYVRTPPEFETEHIASAVNVPEIGRAHV